MDNLRTLEKNSKNVLTKHCKKKQIILAIPNQEIQCIVKKKLLSD